MTHKWIVMKLVKTYDITIIGCVVGPFKTEAAAWEYSNKAVIGSLGYEKWVVKELLTPSKL